MSYRGAGRLAPIDAAILAVPETSGSALYGIVDLLAVTAHMQHLPGGRHIHGRTIRPNIISLSRDYFRCHNSAPVAPDLDMDSGRKFNIVIVPEVWLDESGSFVGRYPDVMDWIRDQYKAGANIYSSCAGSILLAEAGLLDGKCATSHWMHEDLFRKDYPRVTFDQSPALVFSDSDGRLVTAGGSTSWHDLGIHIISRFCSQATARWVAKFCLLKRHEEGQLPYAHLIPQRWHEDADVANCEQWLTRHFDQPSIVSRAVAASCLTERTLKRRFKLATGLSLIDYVHRLRIEAAKSCLETTSCAVDDVAGRVGYEEAPFFRRLFKRHVGLTPRAYRQIFLPTEVYAQND